jgi:hypothetical protein
MLALFMVKSMEFGLDRNSKSHNFSHGMGEQGGKIRGKVSPAPICALFLKIHQDPCSFTVSLPISNQSSSSSLLPSSSTNSSRLSWSLPLSGDPGRELLLLLGLGTRSAASNGLWLLPERAMIWLAVAIEWSLESDA